MESLKQNTVIHEIEPAEVEFPSPPVAGEFVPDQPAPYGLAHVQLLWEKRRLLYRAAAWALAISTVIAFLIPDRYESRT